MLSIPHNKSTVRLFLVQVSTEDVQEQPSAAVASTSPPLSPKKTPPPLPARHPTTALTHSGQSSSGASSKARIIAPTNTKKIGKKIHIQLSKGQHCLYLLVGAFTLAHMHTLPAISIRMACNRLHICVLVCLDVCCKNNIWPVPA